MKCENLLPKQVKQLVLANYCHPDAGWPWKSPLLRCSVRGRDFLGHHGHCLRAALTTNSEKPVMCAKGRLSTLNLKSDVRENEARPNRGVSSLEKQPLLLLLVIAFPQDTLKSPYQADASFVSPLPYVEAFSCWCLVGKEAWKPAVKNTEQRKLGRGNSLSNL